MGSDDKVNESPDWGQVFGRSASEPPRRRRRPVGRESSTIHHDPDAEHWDLVADRETLDEIDWVDDEEPTPRRCQRVRYRPQQAKIERVRLKSR